MSKAVHIDGVRYPYKVGTTTVVIKTPHGKIYPSFLDILNSGGANWTWYTVERAIWKGHSPSVTPSLVKLYLHKILHDKKSMR